jgi:class III poly(R)-hydroxyalkanoic acid synthase PhaE subunit
MNWTEQAETMIKTLTETQKKTWEGWYELARKGADDMAFTPNSTDPFQFFKQGLEAWTAQSGSTGQGMADQIFSSQKTMLQYLDLMTKSWQIIAPSLETNKNWQDDLKKFTTQWSEQALGSPTRFLETTANTQQLWQSFIGEWGPLLKPWLSSVNQIAHGHLGEGLLGGSTGLNKFLNLEMDGLTRMFSLEAERELAFEELAEIPRVGFHREEIAKLLKAFDAFVDMHQASTKYRVRLAEAMSTAVERTMTRLTDMAKESKSVNSVRELNRLWLDVADQVFTEMYSSKEYIEMQKELSGTGLKYRIEQQKVIEMVLEALHIPTRSELDDTYRTIYELKKEVKSLKKALDTPAVPKKTITKKRKSPPKRKPAAKTNTGAK